jgi:predicted dehydrogenase
MTGRSDGNGRPIRVGVVGAGWGAGLHLAGFQRTGRATLSAIMNRSRDNAEKTAAQFGVEQVVDSLDELIEASDVVTVATPPHAHREATLAAVAAGRPVLCEKPLAMDAAEAHEMLTAARRAGVSHATGFIWRFDPAVARMREVLRAGDIGTPVEVHTSCPMGVPVLPYNWMYDSGQGGGALMQHGTHVIDRVRYLLESEIVTLTGQLHRDVTEAEDGHAFHNVLDVFDWARRRGDRLTAGESSRAVTADTSYRLTGLTSSGVRVSIWESWHSVGPVAEHVIVYGDKATLEWRGSGDLKLLQPGGGSTSIDVEGSGTSGATTPKEHGLRLWHRLADEFLDAINGVADDHALPTMEDGWQVMRVVDAVRRSDRSMRWEQT